MVHNLIKANLVLALAAAALIVTSIKIYASAQSHKFGFNTLVSYLIVSGLSAPVSLFTP